MDELLDALDREYDLETGFVGQVRDGLYDESSLRRLIDLLKTVPPTDSDKTESRLVRLLWMMPWVVEWQAERLAQEGKPADHLTRARDAILAELERIFGLP